MGSIPRYFLSVQKAGLVCTDAGGHKCQTMDCPAEGGGTHRRRNWDGIHLLRSQGATLPRKVSRYCPSSDTRPTADRDTRSKSKTRPARRRISSRVTAA